MLSPRRREALAAQIETLATGYSYIELSPAQIDHIVLTGKRLHRLNLLEAQAMAKAIETLKPNLAYVDASDVKPERFGQQIKNLLTFNAEIISEHKADQKYPAVSAASILAKVRRDQHIKQLHEKHGDLGTGYPNDPKTLKFLKTLLTQGPLPPYVRKSWKTIKRLNQEAKQRHPPPPLPQHTKISHKTHSKKPEPKR